MLSSDDILQFPPAMGLQTMGLTHLPMASKPALLLLLLNNSSSQPHKTTVTLHQTVSKQHLLLLLNNANQVSMIDVTRHQTLASQD
jgi:hypothetical protein